MSNQSTVPSINSLERASKESSKKQKVNEISKKRFGEFEYFASFSDATKKLAKEIRSALKKEHQETNLKLTHKTIQVESQSRRFQQILKKHNAFQLEFRNKCRVSLIKDARIKGASF